jgi:Xaa-Pro aminopeptidase
VLQSRGLTKRTGGFMRKDVIVRQMKVMQKERLDALVAISPENVAYTLGFMVPSHVIPIRKRHFICVVTADGNAAMAVALPEFTYISSGSWMKDIRSYDEFTESPMDRLIDIMKDLSIETSRVGIELEYIPAKYFGDLRKRMPKAYFVNCEHLFSEIRMIKTKEEIEYLRRVGKASDKTHNVAYRVLQKGMTELDVARKVVNSMYSEGADNVNRLVIGSGERSAHANPAPTMRTLKKGDIVRVDIFGSYHDYLSDTARSSVVGKPNTFQKDIWEKLIETRAAVLDKIKPGVRTGEIWEFFVAKFRSLHMEPSIRFLGHGIGLTLHEEPYICEYTDTVLEEGMFLCIEPVYKIPGKVGFQVEDEILITKNGYELITDQVDVNELIEISLVD